ncbi:MAG TPA: hypothetical protein VFC19_03460 [Candidatus Limnocylindrales bacterium]|nr:hypothetical protein [Candidatus Limnocylindrales bacterium]
MIRVSTVVTALFAVVAVAACQTAPAPKQEDPDARRMAVMRDEPLVARDPRAALSPAGPAHRLMINASLFDDEAQNAEEVARKQTSDAMIAMRENRWTIYFAACLPPDSDDDGWAFAAYAYKIVDGVSYHATLDGSASGSRAKLTLRLIAPRFAEPRADVFPDRPPALDAGKSCIEAGSLPEARQESGTPAVMTETPPVKPDDRRR